MADGTARHLVIGHSFVSHLRTYTQREGIVNFNITGCTVDIIGCPGLNVTRLRDKFSSLTGPYHVVHIEIGTNDLCYNSCNPAALARDIFHMATDCVDTGFAKTITIGEIMPRHGRVLSHARLYFNDFVTECNNELRALSLLRSDVSVRRFRGLKGSKYYKDDGVHFNDEGLKRYFREVRNSLIC